MRIGIFILPLLLAGLLSCQPSTSKRKDRTSTPPNNHPTIRILGASVSEDQSVVEVTYVLSSPAPREGGFQWSTTDGTTRVGEDYRSIIRNWEFVGKGSARGALSVPIVNDERDEEDESFTVSIVPSSLEGIQSSGSTLSAVVTITDNDPMPTISVGEMTVDENAGEAQVTYTLSTASGKEVSFNWSTGISGTAEAGRDYTAVASTKVTLDEGVTEGTLTVAIINDSDYEQQETVVMAIDGNTLQGITSDGSKLEGEITIIDNDFPTISFTATQFNVSEGAGEVLVLYQITPSNAYHDVSFSWFTEDGTAGSNDYNNINGDIAIEAGGQSSGHFRIPIIDDGQDEDNENFHIKMVADSLVGIDLDGSSLEATVSIMDDDASPTIQILDLRVEENEGTAELTYQLSAVSGKETRFTWSTTDGTAVERSDYQRVNSETVTIRAGRRTGTISVTITDDTEDESSETFTVQIDSLSGIIEKGSNLGATVTIIDRPFIRIEDVKVDENDGVAYVPYFLSSESTQAVEFTWSTSDDTATTADNDYDQVTNTTVTIIAGDTQGVLEITIQNDGDFEDREDFKVVIASASLNGIEDIESSDLEAIVSILDEEDMTCNEHYVKVVPYGGYTEQAFCVAKYEMRNNGSNTADSTPSGQPWVNLNREAAKTACQSISGGRHKLITNDEWQTLARNIEAVADNWDRREIGSSGGLGRGHSDGLPASVLSASSDDNEGCYQTGQECKGIIWSSQRRTHTLLNGEVIWDVAGNAWEWVADDNSLSYGDDQYLSLVARDSHPTLNVLGSISRTAKDQFGPRGDYSYLDSDNFGGLGYGYLEVFHDEEEDAAVLERQKGILRGGGMSDYNLAGVFAVDLGEDIEDASSGVKGFRCTYRPPPD